MNIDRQVPQQDPIRQDPRFQLGVQLFNDQQWYASHDAFEDLWHETSDPDRRVLQGLIQVAVAHVHLERNNSKGATILLGEGLGRLNGIDCPDFGLDLQQFRASVNRRLSVLQQGGDPASCPVPVLVDRP